MKVRFIINPVAGGRNRAGRIMASVREILRSEDGLFDIKVAGSKGALSALAKEAVEKGFEAVYACGGDGTINEVASELVGTNTALGVIPTGSGNGFALSLDLPMKQDAAIMLLKAFKTTEIDVGTVCNRYFFATAGCGFDAAVSKSYDRWVVSSRLRGMAPYFPIVLKEFMTYKYREVLITTKDSSTRVKPFLITFANTERYGGGAMIAPGADPRDGLLDLCVVPKIGFIPALRLGMKLFSGKVDASKRLTRTRVESASITEIGVSTVHVDGEPFDWAGDIHARVLPKKLKVLAVDAKK